MWIDPDEKHQGTQTIKIEDSDEDKPSAVAKKKSRRGKLRFRFGKRDRALEKEQRDLEGRDQTSSAVETVETVEAMEVPRPTTNDEGSL